MIVCGGVIAVVGVVVDDHIRIERLARGHIKPDHIVVVSGESTNILPKNTRPHQHHNKQGYDPVDLLFVVVGVVGVCVGHA